MFSRISYRSDRDRLTAFISTVLTLLILPVATAQAVPSMGRQTGYECSKCHTVFPELTPYGRQFKLGAFAASTLKWDEKPFAERIPVSAAAVASRTSSGDTTAGGTQSSDFPQDKKLIVETAALYWGGKMADHAGALIQYNYDGIEKKWGMEMLDARYSGGLTLADKELTWGLTLNNNPTVSDIYNSTPAWGFPHIGTAATQMPPATLIDMTLASKVGGIGVYGLWDDLIYFELAGYRTAKEGPFRFASWGQAWGSDELAGSVLDGTAPYWRLAIQQEMGPHSFAIGSYGMVGKLYQDANLSTLGSNRFRDVAFDMNYQYINGDHSASARSNWIKEKQDLGSAFGQGAASNESNTLTTFRADLHYYFRRQWGGGLQYFKTTGSRDDLRYNTGDALLGSANGSPNTKGWIAELNYLPRDNIKLAVRYTAFQEFGGASKDYVPGRNASDNNNLFLMGWFMF